MLRLLNSIVEPFNNGSKQKISVQIVRDLHFVNFNRQAIIWICHMTGF